MHDWLPAAALTFAGSAHCAGMCGGFVLAAAAGRRGLRLVSDHALLQLGKAASYAFLGAMAGAFGAALLRNPVFSWGERALAVVAALALGAAGLSLLGLRGSGGSAVASWLAPALSRVTGPLLTARPTGFPLVLGMTMGLLPCPLVYAGLAAAAASGSAGAGAAILAGVALGTLPALAIVALSGMAFPLRMRRTLARVAGVVLLAASLVTLTRAADLHAGHGGHAGRVMPDAAPAGPHAHHHP